MTGFLKESPEAHKQSCILEAEDILTEDGAGATPDW